ncbi:MAG TPA: hypothetical protein VLE47_00480 [Candidatus Saccharimonadales bacterium]|nr:hypothetical protein [Candidatus Saccharimonadales bacterium]
MTTQVDPEQEERAEKEIEEIVVRKEIKVDYVRNGHHFEFVYPLVGLTVKEAIERLRVYLSREEALIVKAPYYLNRELVKHSSERIIEEGDILNVDP